MGRWMYAYLGQEDAYTVDDVCREDNMKKAETVGAVLYCAEAPHEPLVIRWGKLIVIGYFVANPGMP